MSETVQALSDLGIVGIALLVMLLAVYGWITSRKLDQSIKLREKDIELRREESRMAQIKSDQQVEVVRAEASNNSALATARFLDITDRLEAQQERTIKALQDVATSNLQRAEAIKLQSAALDSFSERFASETTRQTELTTTALAQVKDAMNAAAERMTARAEAQDAQSRSLQANMEYSNNAINDVKATVDRIAAKLEKVDFDAIKLDAAPRWFLDGIAPLLELRPLIDDFRREIKAIAVPPREEAAPLAERTVAQLAADTLRAEMGRA